MKYIVRALKYFVYLSLVLVVFVFALSLFGLVGSSVDQIFKGGTDSIWKIVGIVAIFAAAYPALGYGRRRLMTPGSFSEIRDGIVSAMAERGYALEKEEGENLSFRLRSGVQRLLHMYEDRLVFTRCMGGFDVEGRIRDSVRVISSLEYRFKGE